MGRSLEIVEWDTMYLERDFLEGEFGYGTS